MKPTHLAFALTLLPGAAYPSAAQTDIQIQVAHPTVAVGPEVVPVHVTATLKVVLDQAHKTWRRDAEVHGVTVMYTLGQPAAWLGVGLYSPSANAILNTQIGGPNDGAIFTAIIGPSRKTPPGYGAIPPDFKVDLPDAVAMVRKYYKGVFGSIALQWVGATGTQPLLAWVMTVSDGPPWEALVLNVQDAKWIPVKRAFDPPPGTDAQLRAAWDAFFARYRNPGNSPDSDKWRQCVVEIQLTGNCAW
jgi:hypothetical protein